MSVPGPLTRLGGGGAGDQVRHVAGGGHHCPGRLGGHLDRDPAVLVGAVLDDGLLILGLPHRLGHLGLLLCQLEVQVDIGVREALAGGGVPAGEEAGGDHLPGRARPPVGEADDVGRVGSLSLQHMAGLHVLHQGLHASLHLDQSQAQLGVVLQPLALGQAVGEAGLAPGVRGGDDEVAFHTALLYLIRVIFSLGEHLPHLAGLDLQLLNGLKMLLLLLLQFINFSLDCLSHFSIELDGFGVISYFVDNLAEELDQLQNHLVDIDVLVLSVFLILLELEAVLEVSETFGFSLLKELAGSADDGGSDGVLLDDIEHVLDDLGVDLGGHDDDVD